MRYDPKYVSMALFHQHLTGSTNQANHAQNAMLGKQNPFQTLASRHFGLDR
jgi:hypothetical protein